MSGNLVANLAGSALGQRVTVALEAPDALGRLHVTLTEQHHAEGIGWFDQRSLRLDSRQWAQLRTLFAAVDRQFSLDQIVESPATIPFPARFDDPTDEELTQHAG